MFNLILNASTSSHWVNWRSRGKRKWQLETLLPEYREMRIARQRRCFKVLSFAHYSHRVNDGPIAALTVWNFVSTRVLLERLFIKMTIQWETIKLYCIPCHQFLFRERKENNKSLSNLSLETNIYKLPI